MCLLEFVYLLKNYFKVMCMCGSKFMYVHHVCEGAYGGQKLALGPLEPELHAVVRNPTWVLEFELISSAMALLS